MQFMLCYSCIHIGCTTNDLSMYITSEHRPPYACQGSSCLNECPPNTHNDAPTGHMSPVLLLVLHSDIVHISRMDTFKYLM